jgi:hypothetical protein
VALPFTVKSILRQKKNYENSNILPCKNIISKNPQKETRILQDITTVESISSSTQAKIYHLSKIFM